MIGLEYCYSAASYLCTVLAVVERCRNGYFILTINTFKSLVVGLDLIRWIIWEHLLSTTNLLFLWNFASCIKESFHWLYLYVLYMYILYICFTQLFYLNHLYCTLCRQLTDFGGVNTVNLWLLMLQPEAWIFLVFELLFTTSFPIQQK